MGYKPAVKEAAFKLYQSGEAKRSIAKKMGFHHSTLDIWIQKGKWEQRKKKISAKAREKTDKRIVDRDARQLEIIDKALDTYLKELNDGRVLIKGSEVKSFMEQERLIAGLETEIKKEIIVTWAEEPKKKSK